MPRKWAASFVWVGCKLSGADDDYDDYEVTTIIERMRARMMMDDEEEDDDDDDKSKTKPRRRNVVYTATNISSRRGDATVLYTLYPITTLYELHFILHCTLFSTLYSIHYTPCSTILHTLYSTHFRLYSALYDLRSKA